MNRWIVFIVWAALSGVSLWSATRFPFHSIERIAFSAPEAIMVAWLVWRAFPKQEPPQ